MSRGFSHLNNAWQQPGTARLLVGLILALLAVVYIAMSSQAVAQSSHWPNMLAAHCQQQPVAGQMQIIRGPLEPTVEAGGWLVRDQASGRLFLLLADDAELLQQDWIRPGVIVQATGMEVDVATIYMQGQPFRVTNLERAVCPCPCRDLQDGG